MIRLQMLVCAYVIFGCSIITIICIIGSVYYYTLIGSYWSRQSKILAKDGYTNDYFGSSVSIYSSNALIGAYAEDMRATDAGICIQKKIFGSSIITSTVYALTYNLFRFCVLLYSYWIILELSIKNRS